MRSNLLSPGLAACVLSAIIVLVADNSRASGVESLHIREEGGLVVIGLDLEECANTIGFSNDAPGERSRSWILERPWQWDDSRRAISSDCSTGISISVRSEEVAGDREYPLILKTAAGTHIYLPYLQVSSGSKEPVTVKSRSGECAGTVESDLSGYHLIGGCAATTSEHIVADPKTPAWLADLVESSFNDTLKRAQRLLGPLDSDFVKVYIRYSGGEGPPSWRGWTSGPELFINFSGEWVENPELRYIAEEYVTHEVLHLWNGWKRISGESTPAWLIEGYAEFFSLSIMHARGSLSDIDLQSKILKASERCLFALEDLRPGVEAGASLQGRQIYDCGLMALYQMDRMLGVDSLSGSAAPWKGVFSATRMGQISLDEVLVAYGSAASPTDKEEWKHAALANILTTQGLRAIGVSIEDDTASEAYRTSVREHFLQSLVQQMCSAPPYGFLTYENFIELDTGDRCGVISGDPKIVSVMGEDLFGDTVVLGVSRAIDACARGTPLQLGLQSGEVVEVRCSGPVDRSPLRKRLVCDVGSQCDLTKGDIDE